MSFNLDLFINILAIIVFGGLTAYTIYIILPIKFIQFFTPTNISFFDKFQLVLLMRFTNINTAAQASTEVSLSDADLNELLQVVFDQIGDSNEISAALLDSLGLYTPTVVEYLTQLGYIIINII